MAHRILNQYQTRRIFGCDVIICSVIAPPSLMYLSLFICRTTSIVSFPLIPFLRTYNRRLLNSAVLSRPEQADSRREWEWACPMQQRMDGIGRWKIQNRIRVSVEVSSRTLVVEVLAVAIFVLTSFNLLCGGVLNV